VPANQRLKPRRLKQWFYAALKRRSSTVVLHAFWNPALKK
jgi:hypothetical protein